METVDCLVIGGGVIGLAIARRLAIGGLETLVVEREAVPGAETSSRNSEVIHAGLYYPPGSLKAKLCVAGKQQVYAYCAERGIAHRRCGKLVLATAENEVAMLHQYARTAAANGVQDLAWRTPADVADLEPAVRCVAALWSPSTGIIDSHEYMQALIGDLEGAGGMLVCCAEAVAIRLAADGHLVTVLQEGTAVEFKVRYLVNAAGLGAWGVASSMEGLSPTHIPRRHLAKGYYFTLQGRAPFQHLVYPVAGTAGLGIHVTLDLAGGVRFGPDVEWLEEVDYVFDERRREAFAAAIRRYFPALDESRLQPGYTGIRPKVTGPGQPAADFVVQGPADHGWNGLVNLYGIESPGLTASMALADDVAARLGIMIGARNDG